MESLLEELSHLIIGELEEDTSDEIQRQEQKEFMKKT